jgi:hypothetical protein
MEQTIQEKIAYLAGIIDGEGYIGIHRGRVNARSEKIVYKVRLIVCNTKVCLMDWLVNNFGGAYYKKPIKSLKHNQSYNWYLHCEQAGKILELVYPYLVIKQKQAELALAYRKIQKLHLHTHRGYFAVPEKLRQDIYEKAKSLNSRIPESVETNTSDISEMLIKIESELDRNAKS